MRAAHDPNATTLAISDEELLQRLRDVVAEYDAVPEDVLETARSLFPGRSPSDGA
jgi:hypothetical protein